MNNLEDMLFRALNRAIYAGVKGQVFDSQIQKWYNKYRSELPDEDLQELEDIEEMDQFITGWNAYKVIKRTRGGAAR